MLKSSFSTPLFSVQPRLWAIVLTMAVMACALWSHSAHAIKPVNQSFWGGVAIEGVDTVAYFTEGRAVQGSSEYTWDYNGATWQFASADNLALFKANPEQYAPQFGGYCAWAVINGAASSIDPEAWNIVDGKLYLNYSLGVQKTWSQDIPGNIAKAEQNWPALLEK